jgi:hypothetical protein
MPFWHDALDIFAVWYIIICYITNVAVAIVTIVKNFETLDNFPLICEQTIASRNVSGRF